MPHLLNRFLRLWNSHNFLLQYLLIIIAAYSLFFWLQSAPVLSDPDSFYHAKIGIFLSRGIILHQFPWLQFTTLKDHFVDHHFLYHIFLIPFVSLFPNPLAGLKFSVVVFGTSVFVLIFWFLKKQKVPFAFLITLILLTAGPYLFRANLAKAPILSLAVLMLGLYLMFNRKYIPLFISSFFYVWLYGGWMLLGGAAVIYVITDAFVNAMLNQSKSEINLKNEKRKEQNVKLQLKIQNILNFKLLLFAFRFALYAITKLFRAIDIKLLLAVFAGLIAGLVFNPYFPDNLAFTWQQAVKIGLVNYQNIIGVGGEWYPYKIFDLIGGLNVIFVLLAISLILFLTTLPKQTSRSVALFVLTALFFGLTLKSKRNIEYFAPFAVIFSGFALRDAFAAINKSFKDFKNKLLKSWPQTIALSLVVVYLAVITPLSVIKEMKNTKNDLSNGSEFTQFKDLSIWLRNNTAKGSIVLHSDWDESPALFYQNDWNYYIVGLDPTFMYEYNKELYWKWVDITTGKGVDNMTKVIKNDFHAQYILATSDHLDMDKLFRDNKDFEKVYEDGEGKIYKVKI